MNSESLYDVQNNPTKQMNNQMEQITKYNSKMFLRKFKFKWYDVFCFLRRNNGDNIHKEDFQRTRNEIREKLCIVNYLKLCDDVKYGNELIKILLDSKLAGNVLSSEVNIIR